MARKRFARWRGERRVGKEMMMRGGREESRGKCKSVAGGGKGKKAFPPPRLGL